MDPLAKDVSQIDTNRVFFSTSIRKSNGDRKTRYYYKLNHALRSLYRFRDVASGIVRVHDNERCSYILIRKLKKIRGMNMEKIASLESRPTMTEYYKFHRMPRAKWNNIK